MRDARIIEGGEDARVKLTHVLQKLISGPDAGDSLEIVLAQCAKMGELTLHEFKFDYDGGLDDLVKEIVDEAESDAEQHRGKVKYAVRVKNKGLRTVFTLNIPYLEDDDEDFEDIDELPNRRGLIQQQMRHTEIFAKEMISSSKSDRSMLYNMVRDLTQENQQLKKQWFEGQALIENLRNMSFARDLEIQKLQKAEQRKDQVAGMLLQTGPMLAARLLGGGAQQAQDTPKSHLGQRTPLEAMLEGLFASLEQKPEKLQRIAAELDPAELANLAEIHRYIAERREKEAEIRQASQAPSPTNGANQTNGTANGQPHYTPYTAYVPPTGGPQAPPQQG